MNLNVTPSTDRLQDNVSPRSKEIGEQLIEKELGNIPNRRARERAAEYLKEIASGKRDFRF